MYGNLIQLDPERKATATWVRAASPISEQELQDLLFDHPQALPLGEIDPAYCNAVPICTELYTGAGPADALYLTPTGHIVLAEFKLWSNPEARREVVGQILDYARELASWSYDDLDREVKKRAEGKSPYELVWKKSPTTKEPVFIDNVVSRLKRGEFLLLIIGDGIRKGVEGIVDHVQKHSGLRFDLALIEVVRYKNGGDLIIQPRLLAKTELLPRTILIRKTIWEQDDDTPLSLDDDPSPTEVENRKFWDAVLRDFSFADPEAEVPKPTSSPSVWVKVEGSGFNGWGLSFGAYIEKSRTDIGVYFSWRSGYPEAERIFDEIVHGLRESQEFAAQIEGHQSWVNATKRPRLGFMRKSQPISAEDKREFDAAVAWMRDRLNRLVSTLHPECRKRL